MRRFRKDLEEAVLTGLEDGLKVGDYENFMCISFHFISYSVAFWNVTIWKEDNKNNWKRKK